MFTRKLKDLWIVILLLVILTNPLTGTAQNDGTLDTSFGNGGKVVAQIGNNIDFRGATLLQDDGKIVVALTASQASNEKSIKIARYLTNGSLDVGWGQNGIVTTSFFGDKNSLTIWDIKELENAKVLVVGTMDTLIGLNPTTIGFIARYLDDGTLDTSFGEDGLIYQFSFDTISPSPPPNILLKLVVQQNRIITISKDSLFILRFQAYNIINGDIDTGWGSNGMKKYNFHNINSNETLVVDVAVQDDGKFLISSKDMIFRFLPSGELDSSFADNGHLVPLYASMTEQYYPNMDPLLRSYLTIDILSNQKILISGTASDYSPYKGLGVAERYLPDGTLDSTLAHNGFCVVNYNTSNNQKYKQSMGWIATQNDGSFIVGGSVRDTSVSGNKEVMFAMEKFSENGVPKTDFGDDGVVITSPFVPSNPIDVVTRTIIQPDSKILLIGTNVDTSSYTNSTLLMSRYNNTDNTTGIVENNPTNEGFKLFPNPINNQLTISVPQKGEIKIYNTMGQCVLEQEINEGNHQIPVNDLNRGIYFVNYSISPALYYYKKLIKN